MKSAIAILLLLLSAQSNASEIIWDEEGVEAIDDRDEYLVEGTLHKLDNIPFIAINLYPFADHSECKYSGVAADDSASTTFLFDGVAYDTHILCIQYDDSSDYFYSLVTFDEDAQKHFIARFATEVGLVEIEFESVWAQLPTLGFNDAYRKAFTEAASVRP